MAKINKTTTIKAKKSTKKDHKSFVEPKYLEIKEYFKSKKYDDQVLNDMCMELIEILGELTSRGVEHIEGLPMDTWKMRVWVIVEKAGLLPEYFGPEEEEEYEDIEDTWYDSEDEFGGDLDFNYI